MSESWPLTETLARQMFIAEFGHTGMTWDSLSDMAHDEWRTKAGSVLEGWWNPDKPLVVLDLANDSLTLQSADFVPHERAREAQ